MLRRAQQGRAHAETAQVHAHGHRLAVELGWPRTMTGVFGAFAGLLDVGAPWRELDSALPRVQSRQAESERELRIAAIGAAQTSVLGGSD